MQHQLDDIKNNVNSLHGKLDKFIEIDNERKIEIEARLAKTEVRVGILGKLTLTGVIAIVSAYFVAIKTKIGM